MIKSVEQCRNCGGTNLKPIIDLGVHKHTVRDFVGAAYDSVGLDWHDHVIHNPGKLNRVTKTLIGDATKLRNATGWSPSLSF